ncbi:MAG: phosphoadenylyl-sulfate reductase [Xanthobacteraceae bacterium]
MTSISTTPERSTRTGQNFDSAATRLTAGCSGQNLFERIAAIRNVVVGPIVFTTSFGLEDQAVAHAVFAQHLAIDVVTLDTGRLFPETHQVWAETEQRYGQRIHAYMPEPQKVESWVAQHGIDGFRASVEARQSCCHLRKVEPLGRALAGVAAWITGLRADQSTGRAATPYAALDPAHGLLKVNPLVDWPRDRVTDFIRAHSVPYNALHDRGFLSIGCAPCTRAVAPGEPERAGRWWWEQQGHQECGLHRPVRAPSLQES